MIQQRRLAILVSVCFASASAIVCTAWSQSGSRIVGGQGSGSISQGSGTRSSQDFESRFWNYIANGNHKYDYWGPFAGKDDLYEGQSPHGAFLRVYANKTARDSQADLAPNSIIIKENYADDGETLLAVTVMYNVDGYDPDNGDWYYLKYLPDGTIDRTPVADGNAAISGRVESCIECHRNAGGGDFVFLND